MLYSEALTYVILQLWRPGYWEWRDLVQLPCRDEIANGFPWWYSCLTWRPSLYWRKRILPIIILKASRILMRSIDTPTTTFPGIKQHFHYHSNTFCLDTLTWHIGSYHAFIFFISLFQLLYILLLTYNRWYRRKKARSEDTIIGGEVPPPSPAARLALWIVGAKK